MDDTTDGRLRATNIDLELDPPAYKTPETNKLKLYNVATLPQKISNWLYVFLTVGAILSNSINIATTLNIFTFHNSTTPCLK
jgi:hypothetical protein